MRLKDVFRCFAVIGMSFSVGCVDTSMGTAGPSVTVVPKTTTLSFEASRDNAVKTRGGYKIFVGKTAGFSTSNATKVYNLSGTAEVGGRVSQVLEGFAPGRYFVKTQTYSNLVNPSLGSSAVSALSAEVEFNVQ